MLLKAKLMGGYSMDCTIIINGRDLTIEEVAKVARDGAKVEISPDAMKRTEDSRRLVFDLAESNVPIYGFTTGVGWNKDKAVFKDFFQEYNRNLILSHCVAADPEASEEETRAVMLVRLNALLVGATGVQPEIVTMYKDLLNHGIHPVLPERGSVGEADISNCSHIGLAMIGEGEVYYQGLKISAKEALEKEGLTPIVLGPKDGLAIVSSNALAAGEGALVLQEVKELLEVADAIYGLSLEGLNGNLSPLDPKTHEVRPFPGQAQSAKKVLEYLEGSYLHSPNWKRSVQDPLSFRGTVHIHGSVRDALSYVEEYLRIHINSSDDNPCVILDERRMISCSNFEVTSWVIGFEMLGLALSHMSKAACHRTIKLSSPEFTKLPRFLSPADNVICFGTIQKTFTSLDTEIRHLSNPATADFFSVAGDIEDHASNAPFVVQKTRKIVDNLRYILGIEWMHAAQAVDLRTDIHIGKVTQGLYDRLRTEVPFYSKDRNLTIDIKKAYNMIKSGLVLETIREMEK
jgi:histidine ammonia-lyase